MEYFCKDVRKITMIRKVSLQGGNCIEEHRKKRHSLSTPQNFVLYVETILKMLFFFFFCKGDKGIVGTAHEDTQRVFK